MNYIVVVALVLANDRADDNKFDVWEVQTPVEADGPKKALLDAVALSKGFEDWKALGYPREPLFYAVRSVHREPPFVTVSEEEHRQNRLPILVGSIDKQQLQSLRSFGEIYLPYSFMHIG
jgi:hypothetical protein